MNILKTIDFNFFNMKTLSLAGQITRTVIPIPNFLSHFVSTDMPEANRKSNI